MSRPVGSCQSWQFDAGRGGDCRGLEFFLSSGFQISGFFAVLVVDLEAFVALGDVLFQLIIFSKQTVRRAQ